MISLSKSIAVLAMTIASAGLFGCAATGPSSSKVYLGQSQQRSLQAVRIQPLLQPAPVHRSARLSPQAPVGAPPQVRNSLLAQINQTRQKFGLKGLEANNQLMQAAQTYAQVLARQGTISHTGPDGTKPSDRAARQGYPWRYIAENLAAGQADPTETIQDWLNSPSHRKNLLSKEPLHMGVGFVQNSDEFGEYWVLMLGAPLS